MFLEKIISGGQTGADQGALKIALRLNYKTGGITPKNFMTENGPNFLLRDKYHLVDGGGDYISRSKLNIDHSDGTLAFRFKSSPGTDKSISYCQTKKWKNWNGSFETKYKPICIIQNIEKQNSERIFSFLNKNKIKTLNVIGHRESSYKGIEEIVCNIIFDSLI